MVQNITTIMEKVKTYIYEFPGISRVSHFQGQKRTSLTQRWAGPRTHSKTLPPRRHSQGVSFTSDIHLIKLKGLDSKQSKVREI